MDNISIYNNIEDITHKWTRTEYVVSFDNGQRETERNFNNKKEMVEFAKSIKELSPIMYIKEILQYTLVK